MKNKLKYIRLLVLFTYPLSGMQFFYALKESLYNCFHRQPEYIINLMWINKELNPEQVEIHPADKAEEFKKHLVDWAQGHPKARVRYVYDSATTSPEAVKRTQAALAGLSKGRKSQSIVLQDMRSFPKIAKNSETFKPEVPVYLRADLARMIVSVDTVEKTGKPSVYADMDVTPVPEAELFDEQTKQYLDTYGIVMDQSKHGAFENSFHILAPKEDLLKVIKKVLIKPSITYVRTHLNRPTGYNKNHVDPQFVYDMHFIMFWTYYHIKNWGTLNLDYIPYGGYKTYNLEKHGLNKVNHLVAKEKDLIRAASFLANKNDPSIGSGASACWTPTKKMVSPSRTHYYYDE